jgi:hypothetical protein
MPPGGSAAPKFACGVEGASLALNEQASTNGTGVRIERCVPAVPLGRYR